MQGIEFEEDKDYQGLKAKTFATPVAKQGFIMKQLERMGIADKATANFILLGVAMVLFGVTIFLYAGILSDGAKSIQNSEQMAAQQKIMREMMGIK